MGCMLRFVTGWCKWTSMSIAPKSALHGGFPFRYSHLYSYPCYAKYNYDCDYVSRSSQTHNPAEAGINGNDRVIDYRYSSLTHNPREAGINENECKRSRRQG